MTIKEQIQDRVKEYCRMFKEETGVTLLAIADNIIERKSLDSLREVVKNYTEEDPVHPKARKKQIVHSKRLFIVSALQMGYVHSEIMKYMGEDRSDAYHHHRVHNQLIGIDPKYKREYIALINKINEKE